MRGKNSNKSPKITDFLNISLSPIDNFFFFIEPSRSLRPSLWSSCYWDAATGWVQPLQVGLSWAARLESPSSTSITLGGRPSGRFLSYGYHSVKEDVHRLPAMRATDLLIVSRFYFLNPFTNGFYGFNPMDFALLYDHNDILHTTHWTFLRETKIRVSCPRNVLDIKKS